MISGFWEKLNKPIMALAPLDDVTDSAFRYLIASIAKPDVMYTEFTSADGLVTEGYKRLKHDLRFDEIERPIVAQLFGANPENMMRASEIAREHGFDGIDINMGCPDKAVCKQGAGAALIETPKLAQEIIRAAMKGSGGLPVSVKTRAGYAKENIEEWTKYILDAEPATLVVHARTKKELSEVPARWELVEKSRQVRDDMGSKTLIMGNGDLHDLVHAKELCEKHKLDGAMLGRAIFGNPWLFDESRSKNKIPLAEKIVTLQKHVQIYNDHLGGIKSFLYMKKHFKSYLEGFEGAKKLRVELMEADTFEEVLAILEDAKRNTR